MSRFIAEFVLDSDLKLPDDIEFLKWDDPTENFEVVFRNERAGFSYIQEALNAQITFEALDIDEAKEKCQDLLASILNSLVWVGVSMIRQARLVRVVDWSPGKTMRDALIFTESPKFAVSQPILTPQLIQSAHDMYAAQRSDRAQSALRWFRLGIGGDGIEDQFTFFWFSLETAAEALKQPGKVTTKCSTCEGDLYCATCGNHPTHRRFAADAIRDLILESFDDEEEAKEVFRTLVKIRHTLMHGRRIESIKATLPFEAEEATILLAEIARNAIFKMSDFSNRRERELKLSLCAVDDIIRGRLVVAARIQSAFGPDPSNPVLGDRGGIQVSIHHPGQPRD